MAITHDQVEVVARRVADQFLTQRKWEKDVDDRMMRDRVAPLLYSASRELMATLAASAPPEEVLVDVKTASGYSSAGFSGVNLDVRLMVATNHRLWFCRHRDGTVQQLEPLDYASINIQKKRISLGFPKLEGTTVTCGGSTAEWLSELQAGRRQPASWLLRGASPHEALPSSGPPPPGWHPDPYRRYQLRYWDGNRWSEHVSTNGVAAVDAVNQ